MTAPSDGKSRPVFWWVLAATTAARILTAITLNPCFDEAYYHYWSLHPQLSYYDHPPMVAWAMALAGKLFGPDSIWSVRFWPVAAGTLFAIIAWALARRMFDRAAGDRAGIFVALSPVFLGNGFLMTPDALFALSWALAVYATWRAVEPDRGGGGWWVAAGVFAGLGMLSKYNMALFFFSLGLFWLAAPGRRLRIFWGGALCGVLALLIFSPVVVWNAQNDWVSFRFQLQHGLSAKHYPWWTTFGTYLGGLTILVTPVLALLAAWSSTRGLFSREIRRRFLATFFWAMVLLFAYSSLKTFVEFNWPMLAFFTALILAAADWPAYPAWLRRTAVAVLAAVDLAAGAYLMMPPGVAFDFAGQSLDSPRIKEVLVGPRVADEVRRMKEATGADFVCFSRYQFLSVVSFHAPELRDALWLGNEKAVIRFPWIDYARWKGKRALLVSTSREAWNRWGLFERVRLIGRTEIPYRGRRKQKLVFYTGDGFTGIPVPRDVPIPPDSHAPRMDR